MGVLLRLIRWISLVAGPFALLVFFQLQFLPYHHEAIAWWQRLAVVLGLALLWKLWPLVARAETARLGWRNLQRGKVAAWALASPAPVLLVFGVATFPGEWLDKNLPSVRFLPAQWPAWGPEGFEGDQAAGSRPASNTGQNQNHVSKDSRALVALANDLWLRIVYAVASMGLTSPWSFLRHAGLAQTREKSVFV